MNKEVKTNTYFCNNMINGKNNVKINTICCNQVYDGKNLININDLKNEGLKIESELKIDDELYMITGFQSVESFGKTRTVKCLNDDNFYNELMNKYDSSNMPDKYYIQWFIQTNINDRSKFALRITSFQTIYDMYYSDVERPCEYISDLIGINNNLNITVYLNYIIFKYKNSILYKYPSTSDISNNLEFDNFIYTEFELRDSSHLKKFQESINQMQREINRRDMENYLLKEEIRSNEPMVTLNSFNIHASVSNTESDYYVDYTLPLPLEIRLIPLTSGDINILGDPSMSAGVCVLLLYQDTTSSQKFICYVDMQNIIKQKLKEMVESGKILYLLYSHDIPYDDDGSYCDTVIFNQFSYSYKLNKNVTLHRQNMTVMSNDDDSGLSVN